MNLHADTMPAFAVRSFLDLSPDAVAMVDAEGRIVAVNEGLTELTGYAEEELLGLTIELLVPSRLRTRHAQDRNEFARAPRPHAMGSGRDLWIATRDGREVAVDIALRPLALNGALLTAAVVRDVTASREIQQRLERSESQWRALLQAHQDGLSILRAVRDDEGNLVDAQIEWCNKVTADLLGLPLTEIIGQRVLEYNPNTPSWQLYRQLFEDGTPVAFSHDWHDPRTGELLSVLEIRGNLADPDRAVLSYRNIVAQRLAQQRIEEANAQLRQANAALQEAADFQRDFISATSHELRTPLTAMAGFSELLWSRWDSMDAEARRTAAGAINRNARRQLQLVDDLAHAAHLQSGRLELAPTRVDLDAAVREALLSVAETDDFPEPPASELAAHADEGRVIQVLINLLTNALRYGSAPYRVSVAEHAPGIVGIRVEDGGTGVPEHFRADMFDAFAQASRGERREAKGTGLGLYISKTLAEQMDGDLTYDDSELGGAGFLLTLPIGRGSGIGAGVEAADPGAVVAPARDEMAGAGDGT